VVVGGHAGARLGRRLGRLNEQGFSLAGPVRASGAERRESATELPLGLGAATGRDELLRGCRGRSQGRPGPRPPT
jgi:hypothetical protein